MARKVQHDTPLREITLRKYERPFKLSQREVVRRLCLSVGLLQPGDSRDAIVDLLYVLLEERGRRRLLTAEELARRVLGLRKKFRQPEYGVATTNIRRQLSRLKDLLLVEKVDKGYRITEWMSMNELYANRIHKILLSDTLERVGEYARLVDRSFPLKESPATKKASKRTSASKKGKSTK